MGDRQHGKRIFGHSDKQDWIGQKSDGSYALSLRGTEVMTWSSAGARTGFTYNAAATLAAAGTGASTAAVIATENTMVTGADGTKGVALPAAVAGRQVRVVNTSPVFRLYVYPVVQGRGRRLVPDGFELPRLRLIESKAFRSGVTYSRYATS